MKKARNEAESSIRVDVEAEISRLKADTDAKVVELGTLLEQMQDRVKAHDAKVDADVRNLTALLHALASMLCAWVFPRLPG